VGRGWIRIDGKKRLAQNKNNNNKTHNPIQNNLTSPPRTLGTCGVLSTNNCSGSNKKKSEKI
jgi:hypothetical protein